MEISMSTISQTVPWSYNWLLY